MGRRDSTLMNQSPNFYMIDESCAVEDNLPIHEQTLQVTIKVQPSN